MALDAAEHGIQDQSKVRVFISYSRKDIAFADRLDAALKARGFETLIDRSDIYAFEEWWKRVQTLLEQADTVVFVLSPDAVRPDSVALKEVAYAASLNKRFAPIIFRPVGNKTVPEELAKLNFIFFDDASRFEPSADKLAEALKTDIIWIRRHTEFGEAARRWIENGRPIALLLRPPILDQAETWLSLRPTDAPAPTGDTEIFLAESRKADTESKIAEARARTRWRRAQAAICALLVGIILGLVGWINQAYIKERIDWYWTVRPYRVANFDPHVLRPEAERGLKPGQSFRECAQDCPEMVVVPSGEFMMGSPSNEQGHVDSESPQHRVSIGRPFAVSKFDVTFADWDACVSLGGCPKEGRSDDAGWGRGKQPVIYVSWDDAKAYAVWLSTMTGKTYRLLTEAEWEYAARAGTTTAYYWGDDIGKGNANCIDCGSQWDNRQTSPVGSFNPNAFGLYDITGNVWQWVEDCYHPNYDGAPTSGSAWVDAECSYRAPRGGSWNAPPQFLRSAFRGKGPTAYRVNFVGFRVGRTLNQ